MPHAGGLPVNEQTQRFDESTILELTDDLRGTSTSLCEAMLEAGIATEHERAVEEQLESDHNLVRCSHCGWWDNREQMTEDDGLHCSECV